MEEANALTKEAVTFVQQNPGLLVVAPAVPYVGPELEIVVIVMSIPTPEYKSQKAVKEIYIPDEDKIPAEELDSPAKRGDAPTTKGQEKQ